MPKFALEPDRFSKITGSVGALAASRVKKRLTAIVEVLEKGYVPPGLTVRSRIDDEMFTAEFAADRMPDLDCDPKIKSIAVSRNLEIED